MGFLNTGDIPLDESIPWAQIGLAVPHSARDPWTKTDEAVKPAHAIHLAPHGVELLRIQ